MTGIELCIDLYLIVCLFRCFQKSMLFLGAKHYFQLEMRYIFLKSMHVYIIIYSNPGISLSLSLSLSLIVFSLP